MFGVIPRMIQLQPVEQLGGFVREAAANKTFDRLANLKRRIVRRCRQPADEREAAIDAVKFH